MKRLLLAALLVVPAVAHAKPNSPDISCIFSGVSYQEGTVIQETGGSEQMCARVLAPIEDPKSAQPQYIAQWIRTSPALRERSRTVIHLTPAPPAPPASPACTPKTSTSSSTCACAEGSAYSKNATVDSPNGKLTCQDGQWKPLTSDRK